MELLIAGGIALAGYNMSGPPRAADDADRRSHRRRRRAPRLGPSNEYAEPGNSTLEATRRHVALATARWQAARDPSLTGVVNPNTVRLGNAALPFFRSAKTQNTNDAVKQTRMEMFTGANAMDDSATGVYRNKREVEAMFRPRESAAPVTSLGSAGNAAAERDMQRFKPGVVHNNVMPAAQVRVGPGLGVGTDVAASDGFHPMLRVPLKNVGDYKKNNLEGRVNIGGSNVVSRAEPSALRVGDNGPGALVYDIDRRPLLPSRATVLAASEVPAPRDSVRPARVHVDRFGNPAREEAQAHLPAGVEARSGGCDRSRSLPAINAGAAAAGIGAFATTTFDGARLAACRRELGGGNLGVATGPSRARKAPAGHLLPATQRDMTSRTLVGPAGAAAAQGLAVRKGDAPRTTLRDTQGGAAGLTGASAAVKGGTMENVRRYKRLGREATKRELVQWYHPQAQAFDPEGRRGPGAVALRQNAAAVPSSLPTLPNVTYNASVGRLATPDNKLQSSNPRLQDLTLAVDQLAANPYARSLYTT